MAGGFDIQSEAPESNAGDDFHLLWAARLALLMLHPTSSLNALGIEGPNPNEAVQIDPGGSQLLGIDVTEYYHGTSFAKSTAVIHSQLKYSTRQSHVSWTTSRLISGKGKKNTGSIIYRLAQIFHSYAARFPREKVLNKLRLRLVSNRSCDTHLLATIAEAQRILAMSKDEFLIEDLLEQLANSNRTNLMKLHKASGLASDEFCDFLRVFDLSGCGQQSRLALELALAKEIGRHGFTNIASEYARLKQLVHSRMMPENRKALPLTQEDVAAFLHIPDRAYIFPCPAQFEPVKGTVIREQLKDIAMVIVGAGHHPVCLHGAAGIGKTTIARCIASVMPPGSVVVVFDCYGAGSYLVPSEVRHSHSRAIAQICNELATSVGTSLLLSRDRPLEDLLRAYESRLESAAQIVQASSSDALVTIVIDAADNSVAAASQRGDSSFVPDLLSCRIPSGCRLVVTARTHRRDQLGLPSNAASVELRPFSSLESNEHLLRTFPDAPDNLSAEFHELSHGIPRVQGYAIGVAAKDLHNVMASLRPGGKTVEGIIDRQLREAGLKAGTPAVVENGCRALLALPRPIPLAYIAQLMGVSSETARDFVSDLRPGLLVDNDRVTFRDEDFETYLRQRYEPDVTLLGALADFFSARSKEDAYAAENIADVFARANMQERIIELVKSERQPAIIKDPVVRQETFARRARLAVTAALRLQKSDEIVNLLFVVAEASKVDKAVEDLLLQNADLACRYGDPASVQRLYLNEKNTRLEWYGPTHLLCAANYSRFAGTRRRAEDHLKQARGWIRYWSSLSEDERGKWHLRAEDIAHETEAALRLKGLNHAVDSVSRWQPPSVAFDVVRITARTIIAQDGIAAFGLLKQDRVPAGGATAIVEAAMDAGLLPPLNICSRAFDVWRRLVSVFKPKLPNPVKRAVILLCEAIMPHKTDAAQVLHLLNAADPPTPDHLSLLSDESLQLWDVRLRSWALRFQLEGKKLSADDLTLLPARLREEPPTEDHPARHRRDEDVKEFQKFLGRTLPSYTLRARLLKGEISTSEAVTELGKVAQSNAYDDYSYGQNDFNGRQSNRLKTWALTDLAVRLVPHDREALDLVIKNQLKAGSDDLFLWVAERAALFSNLRDFAVGLLNRIDRNLEKNPRPGGEEVSLYVRCSRIAALCDQQLGQYYYERAVEAAAGIDEEATHLLETLCSVTERAKDNNARNEDRDAAESLARITESIYWRLGDSDHFPWSKCIRAITSLSPSIAAFTLGRWDQRGIVLWLHYVDDWVATSLQQSAISPEAAVAFSLLSSLGSESAMKTALAGAGKLSATPTVLRAAIDIIGDHCQRLAPIEGRGRLIETVSEWAKKNNISVLPMEMERFREKIDHKEESERPSLRFNEQATTSSPSQPKRESVDWDNILNASHDDTAALTALIHATNPETKSQEPWQRNNRNTAELLERLIPLTGPASYVPQLDALLTVEADELEFQDLLKALKERMEKWEHHPLVREWRKKLPVLLARRRFDDFTSGMYFSFYRLEQVEEALGVDRVAMAQAFAQELPDHLHGLQAQAVYGLIQLLVKSLPIGMAITVLHDQLNELRKKLDREGLSVDGLAPYKPIAPGLNLEAAVLWFLFGHQDKRMRWRAIHAGRHLVHMGRGEILTHWRDLVGDVKDSPFFLQGTIFYWLAAKHSFFLLLDRLSAELPTSVTPLADFLLHETLAPSPPHALITMFAKRAALRLARMKHPSYTRALARRIEKVMQPKVAKAQNTRNVRLEGDYRNTRTERFRFDQVDTLPYWYSPAGQVFGIEGENFCRMAEKWICDKWGIQGRNLDDDPVRKWEKGDRDWQFRSNRHGNVPAIEDLTTYLELNAMFCVTGELASTSKVVPSPYLDRHDPWMDWLSRWDNAWPNEWLSDRRQRTPLERPLWLSESGSEEDLKNLPSDVWCDESIGLVNSPYPGYLLVRADESLHRSGATLYLKIDSALVSAVTAEALLHAMANCTDPYDYRIPDEGDELEFDEIIGRVPFVLKGWIASRHSDREGADRYDPLRYQLERIILAPGKSFEQFYRLAFDRQRMTTYRGKEKKPVTFLQHWNDCTGRERHRGFETEGKRLWAGRDELLSFLKHEGRALILKCEVTWRTDSDMRGSEDQDAEKTRLYLIRESGTVEAIAGRNRPRKPDR